MSIGFVLLALLGAPAAPALERADAYYHFSLGLQSRFGGDVPAALEEYRRALKLDPRSADIRVELAKALRETGRAAEALAEAKAAVALDPSHVDAHLVLAYLYQMQGDEPSLRQAAGGY